jgi:hypothetical protein
MSLREPPAQRLSEEADAAQLRLAREQGAAYLKGLGAMNGEADSGVHVLRCGDYEIGVAVEEAEGMWCWSGGVLRWKNPVDTNCHVEVTVRDAADGRFLPGLTVLATLVDPEGRVLGPHAQPFVWHPWLFHYGRNWDVPMSGMYSEHVHVDPAPFPRHDSENGRRFEEPADVEFDEVHIVRGRKTPRE